MGSLTDSPILSCMEHGATMVPKWLLRHPSCQWHPVSPGQSLPLFPKQGKYMRVHDSVGVLELVKNWRVPYKATRHWTQDSMKLSSYQSHPLLPGSLPFLFPVLPHIFLLCKGCPTSLMPHLSWYRHVICGTMAGAGLTWVCTGLALVLGMQQGLGNAPYSTFVKCMPVQGSGSGLSNSQFHYVFASCISSHVHAANTPSTPLLYPNKSGDFLSSYCQRKQWG